MPAFAVIGDPVEHSLSPALFQRLFRRTGIAATYEALHVAAPALAAALSRVRTGEYAGFSVTIPHKETARAMVDETDEAASRIGAVNCVARSADGRLRGYNTDGVGLRRALEGSGTTVAGSFALVLGAGGAARAAAAALGTGGARHVVFANRTETRAMALAEKARGWGVPACEVLPLTGERLPTVSGQADLIVNATSVGLGSSNEDSLPAACPLRQGAVVVDMVYRPRMTALLRRAEMAGCRVVDGLWMLIYQALEQLRIWTGRTVEEGIEQLHAELAELAR